MADPWTNYTPGGYDPDDGLPEGEWVRHGLTSTWTPIPGPEPEPKATIHHLVACPTCHAPIDQLCRTRTWRTRDAHASRLVPKRCTCGASLDWRRKLCDECRADARRANARRGMRNTRARRREAA